MALTVTALFAFSMRASANPSFFIAGPAVQTATSTQTTIGPGFATTTLVCDLQSSTCGTSSAVVADSVTLLYQLTASSSATVANIAIERSQDGIDWYQSNVIDTATTTLPVVITTPITYTFPFATTTVGGASPVGVTRVNKVLNVPVLTRYTRAVFTTTGATSSVWAQWVPKRQQP